MAKFRNFLGNNYEVENLKKLVALWKKRKEDFFWQMEHHKISYFTNRILLAYMAMCVCFVVISVMLIICDMKKSFSTSIIVTISLFIAFMLIAMLFFVVYIFLKNSLQFKLGILSSGLKSFAMLVVPLCLVLLLCYIFIPQGKEIILSLFTAVTTISAAILAMMGVHYTLVQQKNERINKNNLVFEFYENPETESEFKIKNAFGDSSLKLKIKNVSENFGYIIGIYKLCGCNIYQIGEEFPYLAIKPNSCLSISNIKINNGDDQLILVYRDIGENYYYLLLPVIDNKFCFIEKAGKCDFTYLKHQIIETDETEKAVNSTNEMEKTSVISKSCCEEIDISNRKEETKPNKTEIHAGFEVIVSEDGEIKTDTDLLTALKKERLRLSKEKKIKAYMIFNNQQLVALATFKPRDENSFISIYGLGKKKYDLYGEQFINIINNYENRL